MATRRGRGRAAAVADAADDGPTRADIAADVAATRAAAKEQLADLAEVRRMLSAAEREEAAADRALAPVMAEAARRAAAAEAAEEAVAEAAEVLAEAEAESRALEQERARLQRELDASVMLNER